ncbi:ER membrane protein complex subunit 8/9-like protein [Auxenochlorella protothecoides]|uniref:ER membrane protein complex subunit 8/9-like protein n=1 Tax=Auxenochlorella protothecoides TaxID=3075 RepID=A0A087SSZ6_AUXPR|nr:ER membrane protein complex subunit 8/9-like protein [Auxenochlorella protothecoides]KFM28850.1 ER membrane protein complex subunit 8/9-like protein [Auxenochlorella protothecoides]
MGGDHTLERTALLKILLHAIKYPAFGVNGVLLGSIANGTVTATDAVPFVHNFTTLLPAFETALCQVRATLGIIELATCFSREAGLKYGIPVVGYYQANEHNKDTQLSGAGKLLATKVATLWPSAIAVVLDPEGLRQLLQSSGGESPSDARPLFTLHIKDGRNWVEYGGRLKVHTAGIPSALEQLSAEGKHRQLADFEDHMEDVSLDWLNAGLIKAS